MSLSDPITREDLIHATDEITPLDSSGNQEPASSIILLNGHRYDPKIVLIRALKNTTGTEGSETGIPRDNDSLATFYAERNIPFLPSTKVDSAVQTLKALYANPVEMEDLKEIFASKQRVLNRFHHLFSPELVATLYEKDFLDFLHIKHNGHWNNLSRSQGKLIQNFDLVRKALVILVDENRPIDERLNEIRPLKGEAMVNGIGPAIITAILHVSNPNKYGVWNGTSENGWVKSGLWPAYKVKISFGSYYQTVNEILKALALELGVDLWTLDALWYKIDPQKPEPILTRRAVEDTIAIA